MNERVAVHPAIDEEGGRRIAILRRAGGGYMYVEEQRVCLSGADESTWTSQFDHDTRSGVYDSIETALGEAERDVAWLNQRLRQDDKDGRLVNEIIGILQTVKEILEFPETDVSWSHYGSGEEVVKDINQHMERLRHGDVSQVNELALLFAPTGSLQEISINSGWDRGFLMLLADLTEPLSRYGADKCLTIDLCHRRPELIRLSASALASRLTVSLHPGAEASHR